MDELLKEYLKKEREEETKCRLKEICKDGFSPTVYRVRHYRYKEVRLENE